MYTCRERESDQKGTQYCFELTSGATMNSGVDRPGAQVRFSLQADGLK